MKFLIKIKWAFKILKIFFSTNGLYNMDLFIAGIMSEWLKFYIKQGKIPIICMLDKNIDDAEKSFSDEINFMIFAFDRYVNNFGGLTAEDDDNTDKAVKLLDKYFTYFWV